MHSSLTSLVKLVIFGSHEDKNSAILLIMPNYNAPGNNRNFLGEISRMHPVLYGNLKYQQQYIIFPESWNKTLSGLECRPSIGRQ